MVLVRDVIEEAPLEENDNETEEAPKEQAENEKAPKEQAENEKAPKEQAENEEAPKEQAENEEAPKEQAENEEAPASPKTLRDVLSNWVSSVRNWVSSLRNRFQDAFYWCYDEHPYLFSIVPTAALGLLFFCASFIVYGIYRDPRIMCVTKECVTTASMILNNMNDLEDPCTDFYRFSCGGLKNTRDKEDSWTSQLQKDYIRLVAGLLSRKSKPSDLEAVKKAKILYEDCMSVDVLDRWGVKPFQDLLKSAGLQRGGPYGRPDTYFDVSRSLAWVYQVLGIPLFFDIIRTSNDTFTVTEPQNKDFLRLASEMTRNVKSNTTGKLPWEYLTTQKSHTVDVVQIFNKGQNQYEVNFYDVQNLSSPIMSQHVSEKPQDNQTTLRYDVFLKTLFSGHLIYTYNVFLKMFLKGRTDEHRTALRYTIKVANPTYNDLLTDMLKKLSPSDTRKLIWESVVRHFEDYSSKPVHQNCSARNSVASRSVTCAKLLIRLMPAVIDHLTASQYSQENTTKVEVRAMAAEIQKSQVELIEAAHWLNDTTKMDILDHLRDVTVDRVGYVDWVTKGDELDEFFKDVVVTKGQLLKSIANIQVWQRQANFLEPSSSRRLRTGRVLSGAYYDRALQTINVNPIYMQFPYFPLGMDALNYGALGTVIGSQFSSALDTAAMRSASISLTKKASAIIDEFVRCAKTHFKKYSRGGVRSREPALEQIQEGLADISGVRNAFYTFNRIRSWSNTYLPGLEKFNHNKLFFLTFANVLCSNYEPSDRYAEGSHRRNMERVILAASNTNQFARIWNCQPFTPMNPMHFNDEKCVIW